MITENKFKKAISQFKRLEKRGSFYDMAVKLIDKSFEIEAYSLILATWNFANFRYAVKEFDINNFEKKIEKISAYFDKLNMQKFRTINFDRYSKEIKEIYTVLSSIDGIKYTGASKLMHLKNREIFIMWDGYIKGNKSRKYYNNLEIVKNGDWEVKKYGDGPESYLQFLQNMQNLFKNMPFDNKQKTFAKAIDEFNYVNITLPIQEMEKRDSQK